MAQRLRIGGEELPFAVKLSGYREFDVQDMENLLIPGTNGEDVRLADVASVQRRDVLARILALTGADSG